MDEQAKGLAQYLVDRFKHTPPRVRLLVGIAGVPASGKSSLAALTVKHTNAILARAQPSNHYAPCAVLVGLDGWHLTRAELDAMPDPKRAHDRRGIHWTFDGAAYVSFVHALRTPLPLSPEPSPPPILAPAFDHAAKDPVPNAVEVSSRDRIVLIEGLYTFLSIAPWCAAGVLLDERWFIDVDGEEAARRLVRRHVLTGVARDMDEAVWRSEENDKPNGAFIVDNMLQPTLRIMSVEDPTFE